MNTHILIPIEGWKKRIEDLKKISGEASEEMQSFYSSAISELLLLKELCNGKQISLDEKDIDAKAETYANKQVDASMRASDIPYTKKGEELWAESKEDYTQALKDLL